MGRRFGLLLVLIAVLGAVLPVSAQQSTETPTPNTLTVSGSGTVYAAPDVAYLTLGVETVDPDLSVAFSKTGDAITGVLTALKKS